MKTFARIMIAVCVVFAVAPEVEAAVLVLKSDPFSIGDGNFLYVDVANVGSDGSFTARLKGFDGDGFETLFGPVIIAPGKISTTATDVKTPTPVPVRFEIEVDDSAARKSSDILKKVRVAITIMDSAGKTLAYIANFRE